MSLSPNQVLIDQTTTAVPSVIIVPFLAFILAIALYRILVVQDRRPTSTAANWYGFWIICYAATRIPEVQDLLMRANLTYVDVRTLGSSADLAAAISLLLLAIRWRSPSGRVDRASFPIAAFLWAAGTAALFWLAAPARAEMIAIEEVGGWRGAVYATIYSGVFIPAELLIVVTLVQMSRDARASAGRRALAGVLMAAIAFSAASLCSRIAGAWLNEFGVETALSAFRTAAQNDIAFYSSVIWLIPAAVPLVVADLRRRMNLDRSASSEIALLTPLWRSVTTAAPEYQLQSGDHLPSDVERLHRVRIEIEDCGLAVAQRLPADVVWPATPSGRAALLRRALDLHSANNGGSHPEWLGDEAAVDEVAGVWIESVTSQKRQAGANGADKPLAPTRIAGSDVLDA
ncbi:DUF6545 domain-containing protein [Gordonia sp. (in: high G+C Gram-positive bacteria)]|uniref:DUF6545 domain-containing protein n=1 Tax=Gordonia sp. (in: high G+C Gram-positive bacteria) TaxID=84139 RepID=UPI003C713BB8